MLSFKTLAKSCMDKRGRVGREKKGIQKISKMKGRKRKKIGPEFLLRTLLVALRRQKRGGTEKIWGA